MKKVKCDHSIKSSRGVILPPTVHESVESYFQSKLIDDAKVQQKNEHASKNRKIFLK